MTTKNQECNICRVNLPINKYTMKRNGSYMKGCIECLIKRKAIRIKNYCKHGKQPHQCRECYGSSLCKHLNYKAVCRKCDGVSFCIHGKHKRACKECIPDLKWFAINNWINHSKQSDKIIKLFDPINFIDQEFLLLLVEKYTHCFWCEVEMHYGVRDRNMATIERLNNNIGHIKDNCVIACSNCNVMKWSNLCKSELS
jgi:hypothetical protein